MAELLFVIIIANIAILFGCFQDYVNEKVGKYWLIISIVVISFCAAVVVPQADYDLARHYHDLETIRTTGLSFWDYIFKGAGSLVDYNYRSMYTFNAISYVISWFLPRETLPLFSLLFCYGVFGYILHDYQKRVRMSNFFVAASILLSNCFLPILYVYSNVRNEVAVAIMALAIYLRIYKKMHLIWFVILALLAGTLHPIALAAIPFVLLSRIRPGIIGIILVGVIPMLLYPLMDVFRYSGVDFLRYIGIKFYNYTFVNVFSQGRFFFLATILETLIVLILALFRSGNARTPDQRFVNFLSWYCIFSLANFRSYQIAMRLPYLLGILAPLVIYTLFRKEDYKEWRAYLPQTGLAVSLAVSTLALVQNYLWFR